VKAAYELFPSPLVDRIKSERKQKWDVSQRLLEAEVGLETSFDLGSQLT
jgi:hypothetical protein